MKDLLLKIFILKDLKTPSKQDISSGSLLGAC